MSPQRDQSYTRGSIGSLMGTNRFVSELHAHLFGPDKVGDSKVGLDALGMGCGKKSFGSSDLLEQALGKLDHKELLGRMFPRL